MGRVTPEPELAACSFQLGRAITRILGTGGIVLAHDGPFACSSDSLSCMAMILGADNKSAIGFAETTLTMVKEFRHKVDEGKDLASRKQLRATTGSRDRTAAVCEGTE
ncbi:hypothetical protein DV515_00008360 [Chloebia gouldiae]|uniref:Uncharacterized protein n=1 Tax=Chloebia gouldiae TaxID=44316 RepID=A0A3L8SEV2_CHLGU|nr:hypothetical protein DV515_00008360 [Chloebia gouldiae]